jgi:hypothetical protein
MSEHGWQWQKKVAVTNGTPVAVALPGGRPLLEKLTIWASSGARTLTNMSCQPRINGKNFGAAVAFVAAKAADPIFDSNAVGRILPVSKGGAPADSTGAPVDPFDFEVLLTNAAPATTEEVTLYFAAVGRDGGSR